jgi:hypothetical protein
VPGFVEAQHPRGPGGKFRAALASRARKYRQAGAAKLAAFRVREAARVRTKLQAHDAETERRLAGAGDKAGKIRADRDNRRKAIEAHSAARLEEARKRVRASVRYEHELGKLRGQPFDVQDRAWNRWRKRKAGERVRGNDALKAITGRGNPMHNDALIYFGGDIKADGEGKFSGYAVRWGSPKDADVQGDFFAPDTDFWGNTSAGVVYHHGIGLKGDALAPKFGKQRLTDVSLDRDEIGLKCSGALDLTNPDKAELYDRITKGEMGFSSGSVERLVAREMVAGKTKITAWPIIEVSITPKPVEPRNRVYAMKALTEAEAGPAVAASLVDSTEALVADARKLVALYGKAADQRLTAGRHLSERKRSAIKALADQLAEIHRRTGSGPADELRAELARTLLARRIGANHG